MERLACGRGQRKESCSRPDQGSCLGPHGYSLWQSIRAYDEAPTLAWMHFYDAYFAPNQAHGLASFSCQVSGYWLGRKLALVVRRPHLLSRDEAGRLHSARGKATEYRDGWGFYAWLY